jgi:hypothetical protein
LLPGFLLRLILLRFTSFFFVRSRSVDLALHHRLV